MKVTTNTNRPEFVPFNLILSIESIDEALTLLAIFNRSKQSREKLVMSQYDIKRPTTITNTDPIFYAISDELKQQSITYKRV